MKNEKVMKVYDPCMREWFIGLVWKGLDGKIYVRRCGGDE